MATFLELTNRLLRRLNEVEIAQDDFSGVRGVQSMAKDAINDAINEINAAEFRWPFNAAEHATVLAPGQSEYILPPDCKVVEWHSFMLRAFPPLVTSPVTLRYIERELWYRRFRETDEAAGTAGLGAPVRVFPSHGLGFGVTPRPDAAYPLSFRYWRQPVQLQAHDDTAAIPVTHEHVVLAGALYHYYMLRDNPESAQLAELKFRQGIKEMQSVYINRYKSVMDTRVRF